MFCQKNFIFVHFLKRQIRSHSGFGSDETRLNPIGSGTFERTIFSYLCQKGCHEIFDPFFIKKTLPGPWTVGPLTNTQQAIGISFAKFFVLSKIFGKSVCTRAVRLLKSITPLTRTRCPRTVVVDYADSR